MKIFGLQKMTLLDYPGHVACTVFLNACDFSCPFCHNFELVEGSAPVQMGEEEFFSFLEKRRGILEGVCVTGGEPCLHPDLPDFLRKIKALGFPVKLDTNGYHPQMLSQILEEGLADYVAMDIKNSKGKYAQTCGVEALTLSRITESVDLLLEADIPYEFRTTVVSQLHTKDDFEKIAAWIAGAHAYYLQAFIDRETVPFAGLSAPTKEEMQAYAEIARKTIQTAEIRGLDGL